MRKSIMAGLTLCAALAIAGHRVQAQEAQAQEAQAQEAQAQEAQAKEAQAKEAKAKEAKAKEAQTANDKHRRTAERGRDTRRGHEARQGAAPRLAEQPTTQFRIPAHPAVRDCVHVMFPQCARGYEGLNDGSFGR